MNKNQKRWVGQLCKKYGVDTDTIDIEAHYDSSLTWEENKTVFEGKLTTMGKPNIAQSYQKDEKEHFEQKALEQERIFLEQEQKQEYERIKQMTTPDLDRHYWRLKRIISTLVDSDIHSLIEIGPPGLGKTFGTIQELAKRGVEFSFHNGNVSALEMYHILYVNKDNRIVIFDDTQALMSNRSAMSVLLSALYSPTGRRIVEWRTTSKKLKAPPIFEFKSKIIFIVNSIPSTIKPLVSRCFKFTLDFSREEVLEIMLEIAKLPHKKLSKKERFMIVDYIGENSNFSTKDIDLRLQKKMEIVYLYNKDRWRELGKCFFEQDEVMMRLREIMNSHSSVKAQIKAFIEETGLSRASFFRKKSEIKSLKGLKNPDIEKVSRVS